MKLESKYGVHINNKDTVFSLNLLYLLTRLTALYV